MVAYVLVNLFYTLWVFAPILWRWRRRTLDLTEGWFVFRTLLWAYTVPRCVLFLFGVPGYLPFVANYDPIDLTYEPLIITALATVVFDIGYLLVMHGSRARPEGVQLVGRGQDIAALAGLVLIVGGIAAYVLQIGLFGFAEFFTNMYAFRDKARVGQGYFEPLKDGLGVGLAFYYVSGRARRLFWPIAIVALLASLLSGSKFAFVLVLLPFFVILRYVYNVQGLLRWTPQRVVILLLVGLVMSYSIGVMTLYRYNSSLARQTNLLSPASIPIVVEYSVRAFNRFHAFEVFSLAYQEYEYHRGFDGGSWILQMAANLIPRAIWPDKPPDPMVTLSEHVRPMPFSDRNNHFYPPSAPGFFYFDYGVGGSLLSMFIVGILFGLLYRCLILDTGALLCIGIYAYFIRLCVAAANGVFTYFPAKLLYMALYLFFAVLVAQLLLMLFSYARESMAAQRLLPHAPRQHAAAD